MGKYLGNVYNGSSSLASCSANALELMVQTPVFPISLIYFQTPNLVLDNG